MSGKGVVLVQGERLPSCLLSQLSLLAFLQGKPIAEGKVVVIILCIQCRHAMLIRALNIHAAKLGVSHFLARDFRSGFHTGFSVGGGGGE